MRKNLKTGILISTVLAIFMMAPPAFAFSVGEIQIKSKFGEIFDASFEIYLDHEGAYEVVLGDLSDYKKLGLVRPPLVNLLTLEKPAVASGVKKVIHISSQNPLFFPSFNLVILAKHNGGALLENFLVTVDFQKGLALNALGTKNKKSASPPPKTLTEKIESPIEKEKAPQPNQSSSLPEKEEAKVSRKPEVESNGPPSTSFNKVSAVAPTAVVNRLQSRRMLSGAIWAVPKRVSPAITTQRTQDFSASEKGTEKQKESEDLQPEDTILLAKGEGLFMVARKFKIKDIHPARIAVALWMKNIDKFIYGNINGIQPNTRLDKSGIEELVAKIDMQTAKNVLNGQLHEWKITKRKSDEGEKTEVSVQEIPLPLERMDHVASIFDWISGWKSSWEENDIGKHISFYREEKSGNSSSDQESPAQESPVRKKKKALFLKYPNPHLSLASQNLILKKGIPWVVFEQHFFSESLKSRGTKEVKVVWENGTWKIDEEKFYAEKNKVIGMYDSLRRNNLLSENKFPFVIHASSHSNKPEAISASNNLRENGYDAYTAPVRVSKDIQIYRVYVSRFANWDQAHRVVQTLRGKHLAGHATAIPYPFTLRVGEVDSIVQARQLIEKLRLKGLSGFLSVSNGEPEGIKIEVFVGAFKKPDNAIWLMKELEQKDFNFKQISP
jgi:hypothetical protein